MKDEWNRFVENFIQQLISEYGRQKIAYFMKSPNFFEGWLVGEAAYAAYSSFCSPEISINREFYALQRLDLGIKTENSLYAVEFKHIPTLSKEAKYRILGPKKSNILKDFGDLLKAQYNMLTKILVLIGPVPLESKQERFNSNKLYDFCLSIIMGELVSHIISKYGIANIIWKSHKLYFDNMYLVEIDVPSKGQ